MERNLIPFFEPKKLTVKTICPAHVQEYINFKLKKVSPNTVIKHLRNLSKCLDSAVRQNLIAFNPVKRIDMPKKIKFTGAGYYDENQICELLKCVQGELMEPIILFAVFYGLRVSEIAGLKWDAIDFKKNTFIIKHTVVRVMSTQKRIKQRTIAVCEQFLYVMW